MKHRYVTSLLVLGALLGHAGQVHAQRPTIVRPPQKSPEERYEDMKKSPFLAATLELIIPTVGYDYAGDRDAGKLAAWLTAGGAITWLAAGFVANHPDCRHDPCTVETIVGVAGVAVFYGSRIWASVSAWRLANRTNAFYRRRLNLDDAGLALSVTPNGQLGLGVSLRF